MGISIADSGVAGPGGRGVLASELSINGGEDAAEVECRFQYRRDRLEEN